MGLHPTGLVPPSGKGQFGHRRGHVKRQHRGNRCQPGEGLRGNAARPHLELRPLAPRTGRERLSAAAATSLLCAGMPTNAGARCPVFVKVESIKRCRACPQPAPREVQRGSRAGGRRRPGTPRQPPERSGFSGVQAATSSSSISMGWGWRGEVRGQYVHQPGAQEGQLPLGTSAPRCC